MLHQTPLDHARKNVCHNQMRNLAISMREFLQSGAFGPIRLDDTVDSLRDAFGEPHNVGGTSSRRRAPDVWKYGDVEFHLTADAKHICLIFCDTFERLQLGPEISFDPWFFEGHPSVESVERDLMTAGIAFHRQDLPHEPTAFCLRLGSGVELLFSRGNDSAIWPGAPGLFGFKWAHLGG